MCEILFHHIHKGDLLVVGEGGGDCFCVSMLYVECLGKWRADICRCAGSTCMILID